MNIDIDERNRRCDSLKNLLKTQSLTQKQELDIYSSIVNLYASFAMDSLLAYAPKAASLACELNEKEIATDTYCHWGAAQGFKSRFDTAIVLLNRAVEIAEEQNDRKAEARALGLLAFVYAKEGKYLTAIDYCLKILPIHETTEHHGNLAVTLANMGDMYRALNNTEMALFYLDKAAEVCKKITAPDALYRWRTAQVYNQYATIHLDEGNTGKALEYALKADSLGRDVINKCSAKKLLATIYLQYGDYTQALQCADQAMVQADILQDKALYSSVWLVFSNIYIAQQRYAAAESEALKAWQADSTNIDESRKIAMNIALANLYMQHTDKAAYYFKRYAEINEQYSKKSFQTAMSDVAVKYETEQKEMRISNLERQRVLYFSIGLFGVLLAATVGMIFRQKVKSERKEKQLLATRATLDGEMAERSRLARDLHDRLSGSLSAVKIEMTDSNASQQQVCDKLDACIEEIRRVAHNLMPVSLQYGMKVALKDVAAQFPSVCFHFYGVERRIEERLEYVIYCCANELVNNALKHSGATKIDLQLLQKDKYVSLTVQDDGCGFDKTTATGFGLKSIRDRITSCNGTIDIITAPNKGSEIMVRMNE